MFIDTHAHLNFPDYKAEIGAVLGRARDADVGKIINVGVDYISSRKSADLARHYPEIFATVGFHPEAALELDLETISSLSTIAQHKKVVAVGEIGLDYYNLKRSSKYARYPSREQQIFCFETMLDLALELRLPVIVHMRESEADTLAILKSFIPGTRGVVHCFSGDWETAQKILDLGFLISLTGNITYPKSNMAEVTDKTPLGSIMIETDCPFMAPEPHRGKRNEPAYVVEVAKKIAEIKKISLSEVERSTTKKAESFFGLMD
jgi:TatD DNase family protein